MGINIIMQVSGEKNTQEPSSSTNPTSLPLRIEEKFLLS